MKCNWGGTHRGFLMLVYRFLKLVVDFIFLVSTVQILFFMCDLFFAIIFIIKKQLILFSCMEKIKIKKIKNKKIKK